MAKGYPILHQDWLQQVEYWVTEATVLSAIVAEAEQKLIQAPVVTLLSVNDAIALLLEAFTADIERENEIYAQLITMPEATQQALQVTPKHWEAWLALKNAVNQKIMAGIAGFLTFSRPKIASSMNCCVNS